MRAYSERIQREVEREAEIAEKLVEDRRRFWKDREVEVGKISKRKAEDIEHASLSAALEINEAQGIKKAKRAIQTQRLITDYMVHDVQVQNLHLYLGSAGDGQNPIINFDDLGGIINEALDSLHGVLNLGVAQSPITRFETNKVHIENMHVYFGAAGEGMSPRSSRRFGKRCRSKYGPSK